MSNSIEVKGRNSLVVQESIRIDFLNDPKKYLLHHWRPDSKNGRNRGTAFSRPEALRAYAMGMLDMALRFEDAVRPEFEARGGRWVEGDESVAAAKWEPGALEELLTRLQPMPAGQVLVDAAHLEVLRECMDAVLDAAPEKTWSRNDTQLTRAARKATAIREEWERAG